jgi:hypothetical protein
MMILKMYFFFMDIEWEMGVNACEWELEESGRCVQDGNQSVLGNLWLYGHDPWKCREFLYLIPQ